MGDVPTRARGPGLGLRGATDSEGRLNSRLASNDWTADAGAVVSTGDSNGGGNSGAV